MIKTLDTSTIRMLHADEVDKALPLALAFHEESDIVEQSDIEEHWGGVWATTIENGSGGIIAYEVEGEVVGVMCFLVGTSPLDGILQMTEAMWYVLKPHRGQGMVLLEVTEMLAHELGCKRLFMAHLASIKADRLGKIFKRRGFTPVETYYMKDI